MARSHSIHTLSDKFRLRLHRTPDEAFIIKACDGHPHLAVSGRFLEFDRHVQVTIEAEGVGRLWCDVEEDVIGRRLDRRRGVVDGGADDDARRGRVCPKGDS